MNKKIATDVKKATSIFKGSMFDGEAGKQTQQGGNDHIIQLLNKKVDKTDLVDIIKLKTNKNDTSMIINQVETLHKQL